MPYFKWTGVDLQARTRQGKTFARSVSELDALLLQQDIALLKQAPLRQPFWGRAVSTPLKIQFFRNVAELLNTGVLLPRALAVVADQLDHISFQTIVYTIAADVHEGKPLSHALGSFPATFDGLMVHMVTVGEESGRLGLALSALADYLDAAYTFRKQVRSALLMPMITFGFFICIVLIILLAVVPKFASIFYSMNRELPTLTKGMLSLSSGLRSWYGVAVVGGVVMLGFFWHWVAQRQAVRARLDNLYLRLALVGPIIKQSSLAYFLHAVSLLLKGGMQLVPALGIAQGTVRNVVIHDHIRAVARAVEAGSSLSEALIAHPEQLFGADLISVVSVGEESGALATVLGNAARMYQEKVTRSVSFLTTLVQPLVMIILGLLITLLIVATYIPILTLAQVV